MPKERQPGGACLSIKALQSRSRTSFTWMMAPVSQLKRGAGGNEGKQEPGGLVQRKDLGGSGHCRDGSKVHCYTWLSLRGRDSATWRQVPGNRIQYQGRQTVLNTILPCKLKDNRFEMDS